MIGAARWKASYIWPLQQTLQLSHTMGLQYALRTTCAALKLPRFVIRELDGQVHPGHKYSKHTFICVCDCIDFLPKGTLFLCIAARISHHYYILDCLKYAILLVHLQDSDMAI